MTAPAPLPHRWRMVRTAPADGASNMALDLTLMDVAMREDVGILRVYGWNSPTVSFGRNERVTGVYDPRELASAGLGMVRRPTGGRALLHHREVTYSVALPISDQSRWPVAYNAVNRVLLTAMQQLGVPAHIVERTPRDSTSTPFDEQSAPPAHDLGVVCFSGIAPGEIAVGQRKLVASSVWRERGAYLQHGSILLHDDQTLLSAVMGTRIAPPEPGAALSEWLPGEMSDEGKTNKVESALNAAFQHCGKSAPWSIPIEVWQHATVTRSALADSAWLWRR